MKNLKCSHCKKIKPSTEFATGCSKCRDCYHQYYVKHAELIKAKVRLYYYDNKDKEKVRRAKYYLEHKEDYRRRAREYKERQALSAV